MGAPLYAVDSEAEATVTAAEISSADDSSAPEQTTTDSSDQTETAAAPAPIAAANSGNQRTPSIHFLGKDGWAALKSGVKAQSHTQTTDSPGGTVTTILDAVVPPTYGRLQLTEEEMDALIFGGANLVPEGAAARLTK